MTGEALVGAVPEQWEVTTLGHACKRGGGNIQTGPFGSQLHAADYVSEGVPSIMPQNIGDNHVIEDGIARITPADATRLSRYLVRKGDIVYSRRGDVERRALIRQQEDGWLCGTGCLRVRFGDGYIDPAYASFYVGDARVREWIVRHAHGATMPNLNTDILSDLPFVVPPLPEQRAIAHILGTLDDKIELNRRMNETLEAIAQALFKSWFVDPAQDELPNGWREGKLSDLCTTQYGYTASATDEPVGPKFLRVTDINKRNWIEWDSVPHCRIPDEGKQRYALSVGDIVVARMADPGKSAIVEQSIDAVFASYLVRLKTASLAHAYYVYGFLKSQAYAEYSEGAMSGSVQKNMNARVITGTDLPIPPTSLMESFLERILPLRQRIVANLQESNTLVALRDALLPRLISGELRVSMQNSSEAHR